MIDLGLECFQFTNKQMPFRPLRVKLYQVHILNGLNDNIYIWFWGRGESQSIWFLQSYLWPKSRVDFVSDSYDLTSDRWIGWIMPWTHSTIKLWAKSRVDFVSDSLYDLTSDQRAGWILSQTRCTILPLTKEQGGFCLRLVVRSYLWPKSRVDFVSDSLYDLTSDRRAGWILSRTRCTILPLTKEQGGFCLGLVVRSYLWPKSRVDFVSDSLYDLTSDQRAGWILSRTRCTILPLTEEQGGFCLGLVVRSYLWPKSRVDFVSDSLYDAGEQQMIIVVRALPPRLSCRIRVNLLSLYGTWLFCENKRKAMLNYSNFM